MLRRCYSQIATFDHPPPRKYLSIFTRRAPHPKVHTPREVHVSQWSRLFRSGDPTAAKSLFLRSAAFHSLSVGMPWQERLARANAARKRKQANRKAKSAMDRVCAPWQHSSRDL